MRSRIALYNTISSLLLQFLTIIAGFVLPRLFIVNYSSEINGLRVSVTQIVGYLYMFEVGLSGALIFSLYDPIARNDSTKTNSLLSLARKNYIRIGIYFSFFLVCISLLFSSLSHVEELDWITVFILVMSIGTTGIINFFFNSVYLAFLSAVQRTYVNSLIRLLYVLLNTVIIVFCAQLRLNIGLVYFVSIIANIVQTIVLRMYIRSKFPGVATSDTQAANNYSLSQRYDIVVHQISGLVVSSTPVVLLTIFIGLSAVSVYSIYAMIFTGLGLLLSIVGNSFSSIFGDIIARREWSTLRKAYSEFEMTFYMIVTFLYSNALLLGPSFIKIYTRDVNDVVYYDDLTLMLFVLIGIFTAWKVPQSTIIVASGHFRETRLRAIIEVIVTIVASIPLTILFGLNGVLVGNIVGLLARSIDILYAKRITMHSNKVTIMRVIRMLLSIFIIASLSKAYFMVVIQNLNDWVYFGFLFSLISSIIVLILNYIFEPDVTLGIVRRLPFLSNWRYGK